MSFTTRADTIAEDLQDLAADVQDNAEAVTQLEMIVEQLREIDFQDCEEVSADLDAASRLD